MLIIPEKIEFLNKMNLKIFMLAAASYSFFFFLLPLHSFFARHLRAIFYMAHTKIPFGALLKSFHHRLLVSSATSDWGKRGTTFLPNRRKSAYKTRENKKTKTCFRPEKKTERIRHKHGENEKYNKISEDQRQA